MPVCLRALGYLVFDAEPIYWAGPQTPRLFRIGLSQSVLFYFFILLGLIGCQVWARVKHSYLASLDWPTNFRGLEKMYFWTLATGLIALLCLHVITGGSWLPIFRDRPLTTLHPLAKILFPFATQAFSFCIIFGWLSLWPFRSFFKTIRFLIYLSFPLIFLSLLYQRGFIIFSFLFLLFLLSKLRGYQLCGS